MKDADSSRAIVRAAKELAQVQRGQGSEKQLLLLVNRHGINQYVAMTVKSGANGGNG